MFHCQRMNVMASRKLNTDGIDESLLLASIGKSRQMGRPPAREGTDEPDAGNAPEDTVQPTEAKARSEPATRKKQDYGSTFLRRNEVKLRQCVYISKEAHSIVSKIVNTIADKEITVGGYIDTVLMRHFEENKDEINNLYRRNRDNLI